MVEYNYQGKVIFPLTKMDQRGIILAEAATNDMEADGSTNLWDGLLTGMNVLKHGNEEGKHANRI